MRDQKPSILFLSSLFCLVCGCGSGSDPVGNQITSASLDIVADGMLSIPENSTFVTDIEVLTSASQPASLQISGVDSRLFQLNKRSLFFKDSPDYENPSSHDRDNSYEITVSAAVDDVSAEKDLLITVLDRNELNLGPYLPLTNSEFDYENYESLASDLIIEELHSEDSKFWGARFLDDNHFLATRQDGLFILYDLVDQQVHRFDVKESIDLSVRGQGGLYNFDFVRRNNGTFDVTSAAAINNDNETSSLGIYVANISTREGHTISTPRQLFKTDANSVSANHFGGDVQIVGDDLFVSSGDRNCRSCAQDASDHRGKILRFEIQEDGTLVPNERNSNSAELKREIFSLGHRNPQGIAFAEEFEAVLIAEHGPQGGDEINVLRAGENYGWPLATFGEEYGGGVIGTHRIPEYHDPIVYYLPSIAPREIRYVEQNSLFPELNNSLLVASLKFQMIVVLKLNEGRPKQSIIDLSGFGRISSFDINSVGEIFFVTHSSPGRLYRIR